MADKSADDIFMRSPVSLQDLMSLYDSLVLQLNEKVATPATSAARASHADDDTHDDVAYRISTSSPQSLCDSLIFISHLLLYPLSLPEHDGHGDDKSRIACKGSPGTAVDDESNERMKQSIATTTIIPWSDEQRETLLASFRRAVWLKEQSLPQQHTGSCHGDDLNVHEPSRSNKLMLTEVCLYSTNNDPVQAPIIMVEWKFPLSGTSFMGPSKALLLPTSTRARTRSTSEQYRENDDEDTGDSNLLSAIMLDPKALAVEEEMLWQMAHTPIPTSVALSTAQSSQGANRS